MTELCKKIWRNGEFIDWKDATVHVCAHAMHYGSSVFEGIRAYNVGDQAGIFRLSEHVRRLIDSAKIYRMDVKFTREQLEKACIDSVRENGFNECYIRPLIYRDYGPMGVNPLGNPVTVDIITWKWGAYLGAEALEQGVDMQVASWTRNRPNTTPAMAKCGANYASGALIKMEAINNGYAEGIALDANGILSEGSGENIFMVREGQIYTPTGGNSILKGITRDTIIRIAKELGYEVVEAAITREQLYIADEVFGVGTAAEVTPVRSLDKIKIGSGSRGPVTEKIQTAYLDLVKGKSEDKWGFITRV